MTSPSPSPSPGASPTPTPKPTAPSAVPNWQGGGGAPPASGGGTTKKNPNDWWNLGDLYNQPIYFGSDYGSTYDQQVPAFSGEPGQYSWNGPTSSVWGKTQDILTQVAQMWAQQEQERQTNKGGMTGYEALQQELYKAGFLSKGYTQGSLDDKTEAALKKAIGQYEHVIRSSTAPGATPTPITFSEFIASNAKDNKTSGDGSTNDSGKSKGGGAAAAPKPPPPLDPNEVAQAVQNAAQQSLGENVSQGDLFQFSQKFNGDNGIYATDPNQASSQPNLTSDAIAFVQAQHPDVFKQRQAQAYMNSFLNMFLSGISSAPSTPITPALRPGG